MFCTILVMEWYGFLRFCAQIPAAQVPGTSVDQVCGASQQARPPRWIGALVGGLEHLLFFHILGIIIPTDELIFFRGVETTNQLVYSHYSHSIWVLTIKHHQTFFPTCQVRVVRFYQSCSLPPRLALFLLLLLLRLLLLRLLLQFLLDHVCINFHLHFRLANSSPSSSPTSELSAHCWTSTWDLPSAVCTAGPQPGTFPAQCALLDLNLGSSQLSVHRWTSTWDLPSSVCTAGPQPGTFPAQCAALDLNGQVECQKICQIECQKICQIEC